jgi:hypothetical protein
MRSTRLIEQAVPATLASLQNQFTATAAILPQQHFHE